MVVLVDANVIIDYYCEREEFYKASKGVMTWCGEDGVNGYVAFHSLPNIWFILRKSSEKIRREILLNICKVLTVAGADQGEVIKAIENSDFKDFEDCLQDRCAVSVAADYIVTRNVKDFTTAETKAITPKEFCDLMENARGNDF